MYVDDDTIRLAANLIIAAIEDGLPIEDAGGPGGVDEDTIQTVTDLLDETDAGDLMVALRRAADRMPEPHDDEDEDMDVSA